MKISTWNVNSIKVRIPQLLMWLEKEKPDIVAIQETKVTNDAFPLEEIKQAGYQVVFNGQRTYNGVAILSKLPIEDVAFDLPNFVDEQKRVLAATINGVRIINVYVPNGASVDSDKYQYKLLWLASLRDYLKLELIHHEKLVVLGDFNIAPEDQDVHDPDLWRGHVLFSDSEHEALQSMLKLGLKDVFRLFPQPERVFSWWDYRNLAMQKNLGLRIDLILASEAMSQHCTQCMIDKSIRKLERPSDHAPVTADFVA